ncbi:MAG: C40 family peptidase [Actinobacteria bacterium]|nr:C40 family peptidase [Actinomycetota bacterium]
MTVAVTTATTHDRAGSATASGPAVARQYLRLLDQIGKPAQGSAPALAAAARARLGETEVVAAQRSAVNTPVGHVLVPASAPAGAPTNPPGIVSGSAGSQLPPVPALHPADLFVVAPQTLPAAVVSAITKLRGVAAVNQLDAARVRVNGSDTAMLGVNPVTFREFAAGPTAASTALWQNVAQGDVAVSYLMGEQQHIPLGGPVSVAGANTESLLVGGFGTVGVTGVDAVVSDPVARSLGMPAGNAVVVSAPHARLSVLISSIKSRLPAGATVVPLVAQAAERAKPRPTATSGPTATGSAGVAGVAVGSGPAPTVPQTRAFLQAALSRLGRPYVWGGSGPSVFDCSGLVQWSMRTAGIVMPRVAAQQAETGPRVPITDLQPGDLIFYHTDPTAPNYISHVAIYLGGGLMVQAPEPGKSVEVVPADFGAGFAGAVRVNPQVAAAVAGQLPR